ncbi:MAG TPA: translation initiation factor eIF-2B [Candidatus Dojkabacteria bacterium]|nr:translation initiation factor eIF-2B [Candidatus Dojkabacteria bacterium]
MMEKFGEIEKIAEDIKGLKVQGATNVCIATFEGMKLYLELSKTQDLEILKDEFFGVGEQLANARPNEPLARNGVHYVKYFFKQKHSDISQVNSAKEILKELCDEYLGLITAAKKSSIEKCARYLTNYDKILTHCHSSTVVDLIKEISKEDTNFEVVCTETRPLYQGRITAKNLVDAGIKTTLIADSAAESFAVNRGSVPMDVVFLGSDQIMKDGYVINKIGSWGVAVAAHYGGKPLYIVSNLLKFDKDSLFSDVEIEIREDRELWPEAPRNLDMYNPAFEIVDNALITGFVTELGIIKPNEVEKVIKENYPWLFNE